MIALLVVLTRFKLANAFGISDDATAESVFTPEHAANVLRNASSTVSSDFASSDIPRAVVML